VGEETRTIRGKEYERKKIHAKRKAVKEKYL
jgi:hypothetical protein